MPLLGTRRGHDDASAAIDRDVRELLLAVRESERLHPVDREGGIHLALWRELRDREVLVSEGVPGLPRQDDRSMRAECERGRLTRVRKTKAGDHLRAAIAERGVELAVGLV